MQAVLLFLAFLLPYVLNWLNQGAPTDHASLAAFAAVLVGAILAFIMEALGSQPIPTKAP
jgi:hypothetical protein